MSVWRFLTAPRSALHEVFSQADESDHQKATRVCMREPVADANLELWSVGERRLCVG